MSLLLDAGASLEREIDGKTALTLAIGSSHPDIALSLMERGARPPSDAEQLQALFDKGTSRWCWGDSSRKNSVAVLKRLLELPVAFVGKGKCRNWLSLIDAAQTGDLARLKSLREQGIPVDIQRNGRTALSEAILSGHVEATAWLFSQGASMTETSYDLLELASRLADVERGEEILELWRQEDAESLENYVLGQELFDVESPETLTLLLDLGKPLEKPNQDGETPLIYHVCRPEIIRVLTEQGACLNARCREGNTALIKAAHDGCEESVKLLLQRGASVNLQNEEGESALHQAAWQGQSAIVRILLEHGAKVSLLNNHGETPLNRAMHDAHYSVAKLLLEAGADVHHRGRNNLSPLMVAVQGSGWQVETENWIRLVKLLLDHGADPTAERHDPDAPCGHEGVLWWATEYHVAPLEILKMLIEGGADVQQKTKAGETPLMATLRQRCPHAARFLLEQGAIPDDWSRLVLELLEGHLDSAESLLRAGLSINARDCYGFTPLLWALDNELWNLADFLLERGADVKAPNAWGQTPLYIACKKGNAGLVQRLLESGAPIEIREAEEGLRMDPLEAAIEAKSETIVRFLLDYGADSRASDASLLFDVLRRKRGEALFERLVHAGADLHQKRSSDSGDSLSWGCETLLMEAAYQNLLDCVRILLESGVEVRERDQRGRNALMAAAMGKSLRTILDKKNHNRVMGLLLDHGAEIDAQAEDGMTALMCAARENYLDATELLLRKGANVHLTDREGNTALHYAARQKRGNLVELLLKAGANPEVKQSAGVTPLMLAAGQGNTAAMRLLLERVKPAHFDFQGWQWIAPTKLRHSPEKTFELQGIHTSDLQGDTALHWAARSGRSAAVHLLLEHKADPLIRNRKKETAADLASQGKHQDILGLMENSAV